MIAADRTFFCSELVAKAFKILGILENDDKSSAKYFPGDFSMKQEGNMNLTRGTTVDPELMVIVDRNDLVNPNNKDMLQDD